MVSLGTATIVTLPTLKSVQRFGRATVAPMVPLFYATGNVSVVRGFNIAPWHASRVFNVDPKPIPIPPVVGQIWPRGTVGEYYGVALGLYRILSLSQKVKGDMYTYGQLWPRGDFIPSPK